MPQWMPDWHTIDESSIKLQKILRLQQQNTLFIGKVLLHHEELPSTNTYAQELLAKSKPIEGTVISTFRQPQGRGQVGSKWESEPDKNLTLSLILYPDFLPPRQNFALNKAIALAVRHFIAALIPDQPIWVKWPNDIYVGTRKICGILIQNSLSRNTISSSIIGVGVNVNQTIFSKDIPNPSSLQLENGKEYDLSSLIPLLCQHLEAMYLRLKAGQFANLDAEYLQYLYRLQESTLFQRRNGDVFWGKICGVSASGQLLIRHEEGEEEAFDLKEVSIVGF